MGTTTEDSKLPGGLIMAPRVPHGLAAAVEGLTREVIRRRPEDIYVFAAQHFEQLLKLRDQYGPVSNLPGRSNNTATLRAMNQAVKRKESNKEKRNNKRDSATQGGWSLNETAKVLEKHRSIFGDSGRKMSTDDIRALAHENESKFGKDGRSRTKSKEDLRKYDNKQKSSERFVRRSKETEQKSKSDSLSVRMDSNGAPRIISQIPTLTGSTTMLAKDIKTELRKNRISSRERRSIHEKVDKKSAEASAAKELTAKKTGTIRKSASRKSYRERSLEKLLEREKQSEIDKKTESYEVDKQKNKTEKNGYSRSLQRIPRTLSMDRVRDFVVKEFRASESLEELQSVNYVDKVQEVIDDRAPVIMEKVEELKLRQLKSAGRRSRNGYESVDESTSTSERSDKSNQTDDIRSRSAILRSRKSRRTSSRRRSKTLTSESRGNDSLEGIETLASETETPKGTANLETKLNETQNLLQGISSAFSATGEEERVRRSRSVKSLRKTGSVSGESDVSDYLDVPKSGRNSANVSFPAVRACSSKNASRSVSRSDSDNLVLPPISPEAPKSAKRREELVLPILSPLGSMPSTADSRVPATPDIIDLVKTSRDPFTPEVDSTLLGDTSEAELNLPDPPTEEIFKDSLNVTPDMAEVPPRPDSLEPDGVPGEVEEVDDTIDALKSKLMEIEAAEKNIERILGPGEKGDKEIEGNFVMRDKLREIEDTEKRIGEILESDAQKIQENVTMEEKLKEIEDTEKRIQDIFHSDAEKGGTETMKDKLVEIQNAEEKIQRVFDSGSQLFRDEAGSIADSESQEEEKKMLKEILNVAKTPVIPELPCEDFIQRDEVDVIECPLKETDEQLEVNGTEEPVIAKETKDNNESEDVDRVIKKREVSEDIDEHDGRNESGNAFSVSPDMMPYSYVLTEGSPYEIPDSVTTVIIPERPIESPGSDILEIILEDGSEVRSVLGTISKDNSEQKSALQNPSSGIENAEEILEVDPEAAVEGSSTEAAEPIVELPEEDDRSLKKVLDSFGEKVPLESKECSSIDIDFIRGIKSGNDVIVARQDLDRIKEEEDKEVAEALQQALDSDPMIRESTKILEDIQERDENGEAVDGTAKFESGEPSPINNIDSKISEELETSLEALIASDEEERLKHVTAEESSDFDSNILPEAATSTTNLLNVTDSESSGEVKETSITDEVVENTGAESSDNSPEGEESTERITESSNEVKETTVTDRLVDDIGSGSLNPANLQSMPLIPELNLDSLQDITVSSFQMTEDEMEKEGNGESPRESERTASLMSDETSNKQETSPEEVVGKRILRDEAETKEELLTSEETKQETISEVVDTDKPDEGEHEAVGVGEFADEVDKGSCEKVSLLEPLTSNETVQELNLEVVDTGKHEEDDEGKGCGDFKEEVVEVQVEMKEEPYEKVSLVESLTSDETKQEPNSEIADEGDEGIGQDDLKEEIVEMKEKVSLTSNETKQEIEIADPGKLDVGDGAVDRNACTEEVLEDTIVKEQVEAKEEPCEKLTAYVTEPDEGIGNLQLEEDPQDNNEAKTVTDVLSDGAEVEILGSHSESDKVEETQIIVKSMGDEIGKDFNEKNVEGVTIEKGLLVDGSSIEISGNVPNLDLGSSDVTVPQEQSEDSIATIGVKEGKKENNEESEKVAVELDEKDEENAVMKPDFENEGNIDTTLDRNNELNSTMNLDKEDEESITIKSDKENEEIVEIKPDREDKRNIETEPDNKNEENIASKPDNEDEVKIIKLNEEDSVVEQNTLKANQEVIESVENSKVVDNANPPEAEVVTNDLDDYGVAGERKQYHIYVPEIAGSEESTTTDTSTFNSAATKIQAGVRGFLTRRRLQSAHRRSSTLDSVPSIQDSFAADSAHLSPIEEVGLSQAATTIQSNYRGYKARQRLRREDAVQKTTLSVENAFGGNGLQHTGEFHDCLPLPLFGEREKKNPSQASSEYPARRTKVAVEGESNPPDIHEVVASKDDSSVQIGNVPKNGDSGPSMREEGPEENVQNSRGEMLHSQETESSQSKQAGSSAADESSPLPPVRNDPNPNQEMNFVVIVNNDVALQSQYLNFITSVEEVLDDTTPFQPDSLNLPDVLRSTAGVESLPLDNPSDLSVESVSLREPLAVPGTPKGVVIEELSTTEDKTSVPYFYPETPETDVLSMESDRKSLPMREESLDLKMSSLEAPNGDRSEPLSFDDEHAFLESSPISLNDPTSPEASRVSSGKRNRTSSLEGAQSAVEHRQCNVDEEEEKIDGAEKHQASLQEQKPPLANPEFELDENPGGYCPGSLLVPDASLGTMSFSMNVDDMLGFGAEEEVLTKDKPILEVTVTSKDLLKLANASQESQLSGERVESPVTMMQIVPKSVDEKSDRLEGEEAGFEERSEETSSPRGRPSGSVDLSANVDSSSTQETVNKIGSHESDASEEPRPLSKKEVSLKEGKIEEVKEQASPKENESNSVGTSSVAESADAEMSGRTSRTYSVDRDSARTYFVDREGSIRTVTSHEDEAE